VIDVSQVIEKYFAKTRENIMITGVSILLIGVMGGFLYNFEKISNIDKKIFEAVNLSEKLNNFDILFKLAFPLGRKGCFIAAVCFLAFSVPETWGSVIFTALLMSATERLIKLKLKRNRPFIDMDYTILRQKNKPKDGSFPSGDASRIWFVTIGFVNIFTLQHPLALFFIFAAVIVSLGRLRLGVHYPTDVWAGSLLGAGFSLMVFSF
jgi:undecaprenyl-diphosphatase